jgi:hypothetical protein
VGIILVIRIYGDVEEDESTIEAMLDYLAENGDVAGEDLEMCLICLRTLDEALIGHLREMSKGGVL